MPKDLFQFPCPCCGKPIEVDTRTGKARARNPNEQKGGLDLDSLLARQQQEAKRLDRLFDDAKQTQRQDGDRLDDLLDRAKEDARQNPDEDLRRPFDLD